MTPDLFWIPGPWPGKLAIVARPRGGDWLEDEARGLRRAGVDLVVSLLETDEAGQLGLASETKVLEATGLRFVAFPIPDRGVPASAPAAASLVTALTGAAGGVQERRHPLPSKRGPVRLNRCSDPCGLRCGPRTRHRHRELRTWRNSSGNTRTTLVDPAFAGRR